MLTNASGVHAEKVGEFGLMATLMLHQGVPAIATHQRTQRWRRALCGLAIDRRVLIYGVGALAGCGNSSCREYGKSDSMARAVSGGSACAVRMSRRVRCSAT